MRYPIKQIYLSPNTKRRPADPIKSVKFIVAHDTGNEGSTARANVMYYERTANETTASAHFFVDSVEIIECIPALKNTEIAYHVRSNATELDNIKWGYDANNSAIGVELCYGGQVNNREAYRRYVWLIAYLCFLFKLNPRLDVIGHSELDPKRKTDPENALRFIQKDMSDLIEDIAFEYEICTMGSDADMIEDLIKRIEKLEKANEMNTPEWAKSAVKKAAEKGLIKQTETGSLDFFRLLLVMERANLI